VSNLANHPAGKNPLARAAHPLLLRLAAMTVLLLAGPAPLRAQAPAGSAAPASLTVISPVFGQLVAFSMPSHFVAGYEKTNGGNYTREAVPRGESVEKWTEMITVTGAKGGAAAPNASAEKFAGAIAAGFQRACPDSFAATGSATTIAGQDAFVAVVGCGRVGTEARSETALIVAIKGSADLYTVQWAERSAPAAKADVGNAKWQARLKQLAPVRLCAIVPGEKAPYPSCLGKP
jgi:hypothetical protein